MVELNRTELNQAELWKKGIANIQHQVIDREDVISCVVLPKAGPIALSPAKDAPVEYINAIKEARGVLQTKPDESTCGLIWLSTDEEELLIILRKCTNIQWVQLPMAGVENFVEKIRKSNIRPILWTCAKGAYAEPVAEHALALTLATLRLFKERALAREWGDSEKGETLFGKKVILLGAGGVGRIIAKMLKPFRTHTMFVRKRPVPVDSYPTISFEMIDNFLPSADVVILCAALTTETHHFLNADRLHMLKKTAVVINVGRGGLIDTDALTAALRQNSIAGAGLDVVSPEPLPNNHPLWTMKNCLLTPHAADTVDMCIPLLAQRIYSNVRSFVEQNGEFCGVVDLKAGY